VSVNAAILEIFAERGMDRKDIDTTVAPRPQAIQYGAGWAKAFDVFARWAGLPFRQAMGLLSNNGYHTAAKIKDAFVASLSGRTEGYQPWQLRQAVEMYLGHAAGQNGWGAGPPGPPGRIVLNLTSELADRARVAAFQRKETISEFGGAAIEDAIARMEKKTGQKIEPRT
jgi:hypothetical protein